MMTGVRLHAQNHTGFRKVTPHHNTGAKLVAQSKVKRLINQITSSIGIGAKSTSVRLRNGNAEERKLVGESLAVVGLK